MKHAGAADLDQLESLLTGLRELSLLRERSRGVFYLKSKPFLHFHSDPQGLFADLRSKDDFDRYRVSTAAEQQVFLKAVTMLMKEL